MNCALFVVLLCPLTVETYEEVFSSLRKELPNEVKRLLFLPQIFLECT